MNGKYRRRLAALLTAGCLLSCLAGCGDKGRDGRLGLPLSGEPRQIDPQVSGDAPSLEVEMALFEGLTRLENDGAPVPGAAEHWEISPDGLTYTFTLREATFSDGTPVTAYDFVYGIRRAADPALSSPLAEKLKNIQGAPAVLNGKAGTAALGVTAPDSHTLVIRLSQADSGFLTALASPPFFPCNEAFFLRSQGHYGLEKEYVLGNGPFVLTRWLHGTSLLLTRSETYAEHADIAPQSVRYYVLTDSAVAYEKLTAGTLSAAALTDPTRITAARAAGYTMVTLTDTLYGLWFNCMKAPLSTAAVRTALRDAVQWDAVHDTLAELGRSPATGYVVPDSVLRDGSPYRTAENALTPTTRTGAADRLKTALAGETCPQLTLLCAEEDVELARDLIQSWQKNLTLYFNIEAVSAAVRDTRLAAGNYEIVLGLLTVRDDEAAALLGCFAGSAATGNYARFQNDTCDRAIQAARQSGSRADVAAAERLIYEQAPCVPVAFLCTEYAVDPAVESLEIRPFSGGKFGAVFGFRQTLQQK